MSEEPATNRLAGETSPYLLQHAHNPVDWYPWGEEALERAKREDKPVLLSIGYAACHWCHVMEEESFEDPETAALMNERIVSIKVDREERPDVDAIYMDAVQTMTGGGGWPLTAFLTPKGEPFYAGTYFPNEDRHGLPAFRKILAAASDAWENQRDEANTQGRRVVNAIARAGTMSASPDPLSDDVLRRAFDVLRRAFDHRWGGFGGAPKFPQPMTLEGNPPRSDAAWGPVPGSTPPPPDNYPPTIEFRPDPSASDWLDASFAGHVDIVASDDRSLPSIDCTDNGSAMSLIISHVGSTTKAEANLPEGFHGLVCTATDQAGNSTTASAIYRIDLTPPSILGPSVTPTVAKVGEVVIISATVIDAGSRVGSVDFEVLGTDSDRVAGGQMWESGSGYKASFVPTRPDALRVVIRARDRAGLVAESAGRFVSYDPLAGSTDGTGWIVPGGPTSDTGDVLPGLDGVQKASFGFTAKYRTPSSETPSGNLTFSYGSRFKLQSRDLWWLAVRDGGIAYLGGFASIQGMYGEFPFVAVIVDGADTATPDRFELRVYESLPNIFSPTPVFAASGDVGGQIQIKR